MNDPFSTSFTPDEIASLPQTQTVFNQEALDFHKHTWRQEGYELVTEIDGNVIGVPIPQGKMLIKGENGYELIDETRPELDSDRADTELTDKEAKKGAKVFLAREDVKELDLQT